MPQSPNPLRQFFRQPAIYAKLPSRGQYWAENTVVMPPNGELAVLPMTAIDEIAYRTPDALFNGQAVVSVIQSCVPAIADAWAAPNVDVNSLLVAIRIASYGHDMEAQTKCPSCNTEDDITVDLRAVLDHVAMGDYAQPLTSGDLEICFRPVTYREQNETNLAQFEQQKMIQSITSSDLPDDEKVARLNECLSRITNITVSAIKHSIAYIKTPHAMVTEPAFIEEFLTNCDRALFGRIKDRLIDLRSNSEFKPIKMTCKNCSHEYDQNINLDATGFFDPAS